MPQHHHRNTWCGRCFTYPQGPISFLPQILATAAFYGTIAAFSTWTPLEDNWINHAPSFVCLAIKTRMKQSGGRLLGDDYDYSSGGSSSTPSTSNDWVFQHACFPLTFHDVSYWDLDEDDGRWAWAIRLACFIAILVAIAGGAAMLVLWSATCFSLPAKTVEKVATTFFLCVPFSLLTLIAGATSLCHKIYPKDDYPNLECKRRGTGVRLSYGGTTMIFVALFYLAAGLATWYYRTAIINGETEDDATTIGSDGMNKHETAPLVSSPPHGDQQQQRHRLPIVRTTVEHTAEGGTVTTKETTNPDGTTTLEIIKDDHGTAGEEVSPRASPRHNKKKKVHRESAGIRTPDDLEEEYL